MVFMEYGGTRRYTWFLWNTAVRRYTWFFMEYDGTRRYTWFF